GCTLMIAPHRLISLTLFIALLVGCSNENLINIPTPMPSQASQSMTSVGDLEIVSTSTPLPISTPKPIPTPNVTQTEYAQEMASAQSAEQTLVAQYPTACELPYASPEFSPNRSWMVELCYSDVNQDLMLTFSNSENQVLWKLFYKDFIPQMDFMPDGGLSV